MEARGPYSCFAFSLAFPDGNPAWHSSLSSYLRYYGLAMRIGIDNISPGEATSLRGPGGMRSYLQSMLSELSRQAPQHEFVLITPTWADHLLEKQPANVELVRLLGVPVNRSLRSIYQQSVLAAVIALQRLDVFFATATIAPLLSTAPVVLAVQFTQFYEWPTAFGAIRTAYLKLMLPLSLKKARRALIFTEAARNDLAEWTGVSKEKIDVVPHGLSPVQARLPEEQSDAYKCLSSTDLTGGRPYILYVSATYDYKNHIGLIRAFAVIKRRLAIPHVLLLIGSQVSVSFADLRTEATRLGVGEHVIFAGRLDPHERVLSAYAGADLTVIPTFYETFGFPVLEAMACGSPVITSDSGSMAEVAEDAAVLVNPHDVDAIANGMEQVLRDPVLRQTLIVRGRERAKQYTWERSAAKTLQILEEAARA